MGRGRQPRWELADVLAYNSATHTSQVRTHSGRDLNDVPQIKTGAGDFEHFRTGLTVVITYELGFPAILGCLDLIGPNKEELRPSITGIEGVGENNPYLPTTGSQSFKPGNAPTDMTQGDWAHVGTFGNHVAVLEGGVTSLGSPTALVRSLGVQGVLQLIAQTMQTHTDFGEWRVENDQGRTSFILRAGANQTTQTGVDEQHWTIRLDVGATGDLFHFEITEPDGRPVFRFHVGPDGRVEIYGDGGVDLSSGPNGNAETTENIAGSRLIQTAKDDTANIGGNRIRSVSASSQEDVGTDKITSVGGQMARHVNSDEAISVGGNRLDVVAGGPPEEAKQDNIAIETRVLNGGWLIDIGNPTQGANISAQAGYHLRTAIGDIKLESGRDAYLTARRIAYVNGGDHPLPRFDTYLDDEADMWNKLLTMLQAGTVGTPAAQQLVALPTFIPQLTEYMVKLQGLPYKSTKARNG